MMVALGFHARAPHDAQVALLTRDRLQLLDLIVFADPLFHLGALHLQGDAR